MCENRPKKVDWSNRCPSGRNSGTEVDVVDSTAAAVRLTVRTPMVIARTVWAIGTFSFVDAVALEDGAVTLLEGPMAAVLFDRVRLALLAFWNTLIPLRPKVVNVVVLERIWVRLAELVAQRIAILFSWRDMSVGVKFVSWRFDVSSVVLVFL